jgi:hypothetical protein
VALFLLQVRHSSLSGTNSKYINSAFIPVISFAGAVLTVMACDSVSELSVLKTIVLETGMIIPTFGGLQHAVTIGGILAALVMTSVT